MPHSYRSARKRRARERAAREAYAANGNRLHLDLSDCNLKISRARSHYATLQEQVGTFTTDNMFDLRIAQIEQNTSIVSVYLTLKELKNDLACAIVGDVVHNLRCVLDYLVDALAKASNARRSTSHQFPLTGSADKFRKEIVTDDLHAVLSGPLSGIIFGLHLIRNWQPFNSSPEYPDGWLLRTVSRMDNADKHHMLFGSFTGLTEYKIRVRIPAGETINILSRKGWHFPNSYLDGEKKIYELRLAPPFPSNIFAAIEGVPHMVFTTDEPRTAANVALVGRLIDAVDHLVSEFAAL